MPNDKAALFKKMSNVMAHLDRIEKRGHNSFFNYDFVTSDDVLDAVRKAMVKEGLALYVNMTGTSTAETGGVDKAGKPKIKHIAYFEFNFADSETGEVLSCLWQGEALDNEDKALSKCATSAEKYFLLKTFLIGTGDEPDPDESDDTGQKSATKRPGNNKLAQPPEPPRSEISIETAENILNSKGVRYGDLDNETLSNMTIGIDKAMKNPKTPPEHLEELEYKLDGIKMILSHRLQGNH